MSRLTVLGVIGSRSGVAATLGAMAAVFALSMPDPAFAAPAAPLGAGCLVDFTDPECLAGPFSIPTSPDDARCNGMPLFVGCAGGRFDVL
jgi:hypothetical protein